MTLQLCELHSFYNLVAVCSRAVHKSPKIYPVIICSLADLSKIIYGQLQTMKRSDSSNSLNASSYGDNSSTSYCATGVTDFLTYEDFLDTQVTPQDLFYLENQDLARQIVELGYKGKNLLERGQFEEQKKKALEGPRKGKKKSERLSSYGKDLSNYPLLHALAKREAFVRNGRLSTIIFIRDIDKRGHE